jgi:hypothetical protein
MTGKTLPSLLTAVNPRALTFPPRSTAPMLSFTLSLSPGTKA